MERLSTELSRLGDRVTVLTRTPTHWPRRARLRRRGSISEIIGAGVLLEQFLVGADRVEEIAERVIRDVQPDVVHLNHLIGLSPRIAPIAQRAGAAVVWSLHDYYAPCPLVHLMKRDGRLCTGPRAGAECAETCFHSEIDASRWHLRYAYLSEVLKSVERVVAPSPVLERWAATMQPASRRTVLPIGIDAEPRRAPDRKPGPLRVMNLGYVSSHKGLRLFAEAAALCRAEADFLVAGRTDDLGFVEELDRLACGRLTWLGPYAPEDRGELLDRADVVTALSQVAEAYPLTPREAIAHGVPVVATRVPGLVDAIDEGVSGLFVDPWDAHDLASTLEELAHDTSRLQVLRAGAAATTLPTVGDHVHSLRMLYEEVVGGERIDEGQRSSLERLHHEAIRAGFARR